jgi:hypothetical protein
MELPHQFTVPTTYEKKCFLMKGKVGSDRKQIHSRGIVLYKKFLPNIL